jgi:hypothetical protein
MEEERRNELILKGIEIIAGEDKEQVKTGQHGGVELTTAG